MTTSSVLWALRSATAGLELERRDALGEHPARVCALHPRPGETPRLCAASSDEALILSGPLLLRCRPSGASPAPLPSRPLDATFVGSEPWILTSDRVRSLDGDRSVPAPPSPLGLSAGGDALWALGAREVRKLDPATGGERARWELPLPPRGFSSAGSTGYVVVHDEHAGLWTILRLTEGAALGAEVSFEREPRIAAIPEGLWLSVPLSDPTRALLASREADGGVLFHDCVMNLGGAHEGAVFGTDERGALLRYEAGTGHTTVLDAGATFSLPFAVG